MKGLEALKRLVDTMPFAFIETNSMREIEIIEKELKALEIIKNLPIDTHNNVFVVICKSSEEAEKLKRYCYESRRDD